MNPEYRKYYVRGVLEALDKAKASAKVVAEIFRDLKLTADDAEQFRKELKKDAAK